MTTTNMISIKAHFTGDHDNLRTAKVFAIKHTSKHQFSGDSLFVEWICEERDYQKALDECMACVNMDELESLGIEVKSIG